MTTRGAWITNIYLAGLTCKVPSVVGNGVISAKGLFSTATTHQAIVQLAVGTTMLVASAINFKSTRSGSEKIHEN